MILLSTIIHVLFFTFLYMKKQFLLVAGLLIIGSTVSASAGEMSQSNGGQSMFSGNGEQSMMNSDAPMIMSGATVDGQSFFTPKAPKKSDREQLLITQAQDVREKNKELRQDSKESLQSFHTENSGELQDMRKSNSGAIRDAVKKAHDERLVFIKSLSGLTLEQKSQYMSGMEDRIRTEIETRFQNASGSVQAKRMEIYTANAARRAEALANQLQLRADRGTIRLAEVDALIAKITKELPNITTEKKTKLAKKIDERILKIGKNKRLPETSKTEISASLTTLRNELVK